MEVGEVLGTAAERAARVAAQGVQAGRWAVQEAATAVSNRREEIRVHHTDESVRQSFQKILDSERGLAVWALKLEIPPSQVDPSKLDSELLRREARAALQVYAEHFVRFSERDNIGKMTHYALLIHDMLQYVGDDFTEADLPLDQIHRERLHAELTSVAKVKAKNTI